MFRRKNTIKIFIFSLVILSLFLIRETFAQTSGGSSQIPITAYVVGADNNSLPSGDYEVRFAIYTKDRTEIDKYPSNSDNGSRIWEEVQKVHIFDGVLTAYLGSETPFPTGLTFSGSTYYLGIRIGNDSETAPRKKLGAVPTALDSVALQGKVIGASENNIPVLGKNGLLETAMIPDLTQVGTISKGSWEGDVLAPEFGGTGLSTYAVGDLLYASSSSALAKLAAGTSGQYLTIVNGLPAWVTLDPSAAQNISNTDDAVILADSDADGVGDVLLKTGATNRLVILNNGNVGIGTDVPSSKLEVSGIITATGGNSTQWNTAYGWGNHASVGYLTGYTETDPIFSVWDKSTGISIVESQISDLGSYLTAENDPVFVVSAAHGIAGTDITNWNTAFGWGNHAGAGYLSGTKVDSFNGRTGAVTLTGGDVTGALTFTPYDATNPSGYISDGNTNWDNSYGFITDGNTGWDNSYGLITASSLDTLTNKSGNISMWTNDANFITSAGAPVQSVAGRTGSVILSKTDVGLGNVPDLSFSGSNTGDQDLSGLVTKAGSLTQLTTRSHADLQNLVADDHTQYALLAGRSGGQLLIGGTGSGENLTLQSTANATKGKILFGTSAYDEVNNRLGIGTASPNELLTIQGTASLYELAAAPTATSGYMKLYSLGVTSDGIDSYTKLNLHMDGANGSTTFTDSSWSPKTATATGNAQMSTTQSKFNGASGYFSSGNSYLTIPDSADFAFSTNDFTLDFWMYETAQSGGLIYAQVDSGMQPINIQKSGSNLVLYLSSTGASWDIANGTVIGSITTGVWHHVALARQGTAIRYFLDGTLNGTINTAAPLKDATGSVFMGSYPGQYWTGYLDEFRISKGIARWTANFTPPTAAYSGIQEGMYAMDSLGNSTLLNTGINNTGSGLYYNGGNFGIGDTSPAALLTVGNGDLFQVNSSGAIAASAGYTQGSGNFAISGSGTFSTGTGTVSLNGATTIAAGKNLALASGIGTFAQTYTGTATAATITANSLTSGNILSLTSTSTAAASNTQAGLNISLSGANGTATQTTYGSYITNTHTGTTSTNVGGYFSASGATNNYALITNGGNVGIGTASPTAILHLKAGTATAGTAPLKFTSGTLLTTPEIGAIEFDGNSFYGSININSFVSSYPLAQSDTYVKATSKYDTSFWPYYATDPAKSITGSQTSNSWVGANGSITNQRFHMDLGSAVIVTRVYYENAHHYGGSTGGGVKNFTLWGSNDANAFAELTYGVDTNWTQLATSQSTFDQHVAADIADPKYITVTNTTAYRYYAFKFADRWSTESWMGVRRLELQTGGIIGGRKGIVLNDGTDLVSGRIPFATTNGRLTDNANFAFNGTNFGIGDTSPAALLTVGNGDLFQVNSSGAIAASAGYTQGSGNFAISGSGTFSTGTGNISLNGSVITNITQTGATNFSTGTGTVSLNGVTTIAAGKNLALASGIGTFAQTYTGTATAATITANSLTSGNILSLTSTSTAAASNTQAGLNISLSGANGTATQTTYGSYITNTHTGTTSTNVGGYFSASGATNNYALITNGGNVGIGTTSPGAKLEVNQTTDSALGLRVNGSAGNWAQYINNTAAAGSSYGLEIFAGGDSTDYAIATYASDGVTPYFFVRGDGNVGIGTVSPGAKLDIGLAGTTLGTLRLEGNTSGYIQLQPAAAAGSWTMTLPAAVGGAGQQLTDVAGDGITSWAAAGSLRSLKNIDGLFGDPINALNQILSTKIYNFHYKSGLGTGDTKTQYVGVMADEASWAMHYDNSIINPVNTLGYMVLGMQALDTKISTNSENINGLVDNQNMIVQQLTSQLADQSLTVNEKLNIIGANLSSLNQEQYDKQIKNIKEQISDNADQIAGQTQLIASLRAQIVELQAQIATPVDVAQIDLNKNGLEYLNQLLGVDTSKPGDIAIIGQLTAKKVIVDGVETGAISISVIDKDAPTIGTAVIIAGDTIATVFSEAVSDKTKVFVTPQAEKPFLWSIDGKKDGEFSIVLDAAQLKDVSFDWWIIDSTE